MTAWADALRVARLVAADPHGLGGVVLRAGAGPVRDAWLDALRRRLPSARPFRRMPGGIADDRLLGGLDLAATLAAGRPVAQTGLLAECHGGLVVVPMAERLEPGIAARLCAALDTGAVRVERDGLGRTLPARFGLILLDEGIGADEGVPAALAERLAFHLDLGAVAWGEVKESGCPPDADGLDFEVPDDPPASCTSTPDEAIAALCQTAEMLGIASLRGPLLAMRVARLSAFLDERDAVSDTDTIEAARLVLAPRATQLPATESASDPGSPETPAEESGDDTAQSAPKTAPETGGNAASSLDDSVVEAARAAIPARLLAALTGGGPRPSAPRAGKAGVAAASTRTGRPAGSRPGDPRQGRLNLIETLRAAAPWQRIRQGQRGSQGGGTSGRVIVHAQDFRITRFVQRTETTTIFAVDASGSAALERLAEAKGAVELLLAEAYIRRDKVALVAFRGRSAEVILAPTRSLVRARRGLAGLPGGGGTPLASGIDAAAALALGVRRGGGTPVVVMLTDGRANVARSGEPGRAQAGTDCLQSAHAFRTIGVRAILIDTAARPQEPASRLADAMGARYLPLPYADAGAMSAAIRSAT